MIIDYRNDNYASLQDIEYMLGDLDNYYKPILVQGLFNDSYQRYNCRGDPTRQMPIDTYLDKVIPFIRILINEKKTTEQKIQLDIGINLVHITDGKRMRFYTKSENIKCLPSSNTEDLLNELLASLYEKFKEDLRLCHTSSSFVYESIEELNIHFHKVDLQRGASYINTPNWIKTKKATINPKNTNDVNCFMFAATITLYHKEFDINPERITKRLIEHVSKLNWYHIYFPASYKDYEVFEKLNKDITLKLLYVPFNQKSICSEYISIRNYLAKKQITLLKITDNKEKWYFLSLPSIPTEDGYLRLTKSFSRLMQGISSKSHGDVYCYGCFHSFKTDAALKKHKELCKNNKFCEEKLPKQGKNFNYHKPGTKTM